MDLKEFEKQIKKLGYIPIDNEKIFKKDCIVLTLKKERWTIEIVPHLSILIESEFAKCVNFPICIVQPISIERLKFWEPKLDALTQFINSTDYEVAIGKAKIPEEPGPVTFTKGQRRALIQPYSSLIVRYRKNEINNWVIYDRIEIPSQSDKIQKIFDGIPKPNTIKGSKEFKRTFMSYTEDKRVVLQHVFTEAKVMKIIALDSGFIKTDIANPKNKDLWFWISCGGDFIHKNILTKDGNQWYEIRRGGNSVLAKTDLELYKMDQILIKTAIKNYFKTKH